MLPGADYSCGCMDYGFRRPKEAWEASDGAVHLLKELSERAPETVPEFMPALADLAALEDFEACRGLQTTIWKQLHPIAKGLGKRVGHRGFNTHSSVAQQEAWGGMRVASSLCKQSMHVRNAGLWCAEDLHEAPELVSTSL